MKTVAETIVDTLLEGQLPDDPLPPNVVEVGGRGSMTFKDGQSVGYISVYAGERGQREMYFRVQNPEEWPLGGRFAYNWRAWRPYRIDVNADSPPQEALEKLPPSGR